MIINGKHLDLSVKNAIRTLKGRRRHLTAFFVATLCFSAGSALTRKLVPDFNADGRIALLQSALYAIGAITFIYGAARRWRLVNPPELPTAKDRPFAIKGLTAFTEDDGELFRKLGREDELQKLLGLVLDNQVLMIVIRGASGAGKTSLLRAGLKHIIGDRAVFHYWEAVPAKPDKGLLRAIQETWPEGAAKPETLAKLVNPSDALGRQSHVIVLDQFEQLRGTQEIFQLLRRILRESRPPHRITWVIAFRPEFSDVWLDFINPEQENGVRPPKDVPLRLFTTEQARGIIGQLINESDLKDSIEQSIIDNLVEAATVNGEVSPVDIGIGLQVLTELHKRQSSQTITKRDYQFAGGAEGLLTQYISRCLEPFSEESQEAILKAMLALRDPQENRQRLATGLTIDELAVEAGTAAHVLKMPLNRLADRDVRLLEVDTPTDGSAARYRLPHERLIPALYRLTGKLLAEVDQAKLKFQNAFQAWQTNDKRSRYLLKGKDLRLVQHYETQIPWGKDEQEKKSFLFRSKRRRHFVRAATVAAVTVSIGAGWFSILQYQHFENRRYLTENGYPAELYNFQHQLKKLELIEPLNLEQFIWLSSDSIEELSLKATSSSNSIAGLASLSRCRSLKKLTLDLRDSQVRDLQPLGQLKELTQLTLYFRDSQVRDLQSLGQLKELMQLTLYLRDSQVRDLQSLGQLKELTELTLELDASQIGSLELLANLSNRMRLTINVNVAKMSNLEPLTKLNNLAQLTLNLSDSQASNLDPLAKLSNLTQLTLELRGSQPSNLDPLAKLSNLTQLTLELRGSQPSNLDALAKLSNLTQLTLMTSDPSDDSQPSNLQMLAKLSKLSHLRFYGFRHVNNLQLLEQLKGLTQVELAFNSSLGSDLRPLENLKSLTQLTLSFSSSEEPDLQPLEKLKGLTQLVLSLSGSQKRNLQSLEQLKELTQLTLFLGGSQVRDLQSLGQLKGLTQLTLDLRESQVTDLQPLEQVKGLTNLTLSLDDSRALDLQPLKQLKELKYFSFVSTSQLNNLELLRELTTLQTLLIENATRAQRMSLRSIPSSLVELRF
jgi:Leucine-rich repeat (LRR) protein